MARPTAAEATRPPVAPSSSFAQLDTRRELLPEHEYDTRTELLATRRRGQRPGPSPPSPLIAVEGAVDRFCGRPLLANPYVRQNAANGWAAWREGWLDADSLLELRGQAEANRWLTEAA